LSQLLVTELRLMTSFFLFTPIEADVIYFTFVITNYCIWGAAAETETVTVPETFPPFAS